jgi:hypothetical protein
MGANIGKKVDPKPKQQAEKKNAGLTCGCQSNDHYQVGHFTIHLNIRPAIRRLQNQEQFPNTFRGFKRLRNSQETQS